MSRIYLGGAGGAPTNNIILSLRDSARRDHLIGASSVASDLMLADVDERHLVPSAASAEYRDALLDLLVRCRPDFMHVQNDYEVRAVSHLRDDLEEIGVRTYLPAAPTVEVCIDKFRSYQIWHEAGLQVPRTIELREPNDVIVAFELLGPRVWLRAKVGGGGAGSVPTDDASFARLWVERMDGWGMFTAAEMLGERSVTWQSLWFHGELIVAQSRRRHLWSFGNRTVSGVTGVTGVAETFRHPDVDALAKAGILAIDKEPHGIFGVDMTYGLDGKLNLTEINIGRFFTTIYFFAAAGLNLPAIYCDVALDQKFPSLPQRINPLPDGLVWIRGMDVAPVLTTVEKLASLQEPWW